MTQREWAVKQYVDEKRSFRSIGNEIGKNPKIIRDWVLKSGFQPRSRSKAQKLYVKKNGPPVTGPRSKETKKKISEGLSKFIEELSDEEREAMRQEKSERAKAQWDAMSQEERETALLALREASLGAREFGSKAENKIAELLSKKYVVEQRSKAITYPYEIDILLMAERIAIECDGPTHFKEIYGPEELAKTQARDAIKNGFITGVGLTLIRVEDHTTSFSLASCRRTVRQLLKIIEELMSEKRKRGGVITIKLQ